MDRLRCKERVVVFNGFSSTEIDKMDMLLRKSGEETLEKKFCTKVASSFNRSSGRSAKSVVGKSLVKWSEVHSWFQSRIHDYPSKVISSPSTSERLSTATEVVPTKKSNTNLQIIEAGEKRPDKGQWEFEARSSKEGAWFDVDMFLAHRVDALGEAEVRVRFLGFGPEEDEWINIIKSVRERSRPLKSSECQKINVGDYVLCFQERQTHALHLDAHVVEIERKIHDVRSCKCFFLVRYDHDNTEEKVRLRRLSCRPTF